MPKVDPFALKRPISVPKTKTFTDPANPGVELTLTICPGTEFGAQLANMERAQKYIQDYIKGRDGGPPAPLPPVDGKEIALNESLCSVIAFLESIEVPA